MSSSINPVKRAAAGLTRRHSRLSAFAASAATAGVLSAAGLAVGSAPWSQAAADAAKTVQSGSQSTPGHSAAAFDAVTSGKGQLDTLHSAAAGSNVKVTPADVKAAPPTRPPGPPWTTPSSALLPPSTVAIVYVAACYATILSI